MHDRDYNIKAAAVITTWVVSILFTMALCLAFGCFDYYGLQFGAYDDMGATTQTDGPVRFDATAIMDAADMAGGIDLSIPAECVNVSAVNGVNLFACRGIFDGIKKTPSALCASIGGYVCSDGGLIDSAKCSALGGFFFSAAPGKLDRIGKPQCGAATIDEYRGLLGCGTGKTYPLSAPCYNFTSVFSCYQQTEGIDCSKGSGSNDEVINNNPKSGALCCIGL